MRYRVGNFGWKLAYYLRIPLYFRYTVEQDVDANVFIATSSDIKGLNVECDKLSDIQEIVLDCAKYLVWGMLHPNKKFLKEHPEPFRNEHLNLNGWARVA